MKKMVVDGQEVDDWKCLCSPVFILIRGEPYIVLFRPLADKLADRR